MDVDRSGSTAGAEALERIDVFRLAEEKDHDVIELYCVSLEGIFFNPWFAAVETDQEGEGIAIENLLEQRCADAREWTEVPDELTIPEWAMVRTEESQMIVRKNGVAFVASPERNRGVCSHGGSPPGSAPARVRATALEILPSDGASAPVLPNNERSLSNVPRPASSWTLASTLS